MFKKITLAATLCYVAITMVNCQNLSKPDESEKNNALLAAIVQTYNLDVANANITTLNNSQFILNGSWNTFTGNATTKDTIVTISAKQGSNGIVLTDSSGFGGYSSCGIITTFDNSAGYYIAQNPENNGACFTGDTNKGKYYKIVFFAEGTKYWYCTVNGTAAASSQAAALAVTDTATRTSPGTSGCGSSSWSRLEKK